VQETIRKKTHSCKVGHFSALNVAVEIANLVFLKEKWKAQTANKNFVGKKNNQVSDEEI